MHILGRKGLPSSIGLRSFPIGEKTKEQRNRRVQGSQASFHCRNVAQCFDGASMCASGIQVRQISNSVCAAFLSLSANPVMHFGIESTKNAPFSVAYFSERRFIASRAFPTQISSLAERMAKNRFSLLPSLHPLCQISTSMSPMKCV